MLGHLALHELGDHDLDRLRSFIPTCAEKEAESKDVKKVQRIEFVDDQEKPIEGVNFLPFGLNTSYFWPEDLMGKATTYRSNAEGVIESNILLRLVVVRLFANRLMHGFPPFTRITGCPNQNH